MATYDLTSKSTAFIDTDTVAVYPSKEGRTPYVMETIIDVAKMIENGYTMAAGDVFQTALEVPAGSFVLLAGAEVMTAFTGTTPTVDIDFAAGNDFIDGGDVSTTGYLAAGTDGQGTVVGGTSTFTQLVTTTDTVDVTLNAGASDVTAGVLRVFVVVYDVAVHGDVLPTIVDRDRV